MSIRDKMVLQLSKEATIPKWMMQEKTTLIQKEPPKDIILNNYSLIPCSPVIWKIPTAFIKEEIY